ncbi:MAG: TolC family protein [Betaproteobacteria bacterium]|nr:TolC family protein [Betaproteobacteria bacterium]
MAGAADGALCGGGGGRSEPAPAAGNPAHAAPAVEPEKIYELAELIDIAQRTNPETRIAWERAREAALAIGVAEAVHAPILSAKASAAYQRVPLPLPKTILNPQGFFVADTQIFLPALTLKWLLFDFGGKQAAIDATQEALAAANFGFNATHQKVVFEVTRAYYGVNTAQGRVEVARAALALALKLQARCRGKTRTRAGDAARSAAGARAKRPCGA